MFADLPMKGQTFKKIKYKNKLKSWTCWHTPVISALETLRQEDQKFDVSLGQ
jgi:hypothetical protein